MINNPEEIIKEILKTRDKAVSEHSKELLLSTQIEEVEDSESEGYMNLSKLESRLITSEKYLEDEVEYHVAFVEEKYYHEGKLSHHGYLLYHFAEYNGDLIIEDIAW